MHPLYGQTSELLSAYSVGPLVCPGARRGWRGRRRGGARVNTPAPAVHPRCALDDLFVGCYDSPGTYAGDMSESAAELPADDAPLARAADDARRGVATHLTIHGERVAVIMPEGVIEALRDFAALLTDERVAGY